MGRGGDARRSLAAASGQGVSGSTTDGATQPDVEEVGVDEEDAASCLNTSRRRLSVGLLSNGRAKRTTDDPIALVLGAGAAEDSKREAKNCYQSTPQCLANNINSSLIHINIYLHNKSVGVCVI